MCFLQSSLEWHVASTNSLGFGKLTANSRCSRHFKKMWMLHEHIHNHAGESLWLRSNIFGQFCFTLQAIPKRVTGVIPALNHNLGPISWTASKKGIKRCIMLNRISTHIDHSTLSTCITAFRCNDKNLTAPITTFLLQASSGFADRHAFRAGRARCGQTKSQCCHMLPLFLTVAGARES